MAPPRLFGIRRLNALFGPAREAVFVLDAQCRLVYANRAWEELTGHDAETVAGMECLPPGPNSDGPLSQLGSSFCPTPEALSGQPSGGATLIVHAGGERLWRRLEFWPYHDARNQLIGLLGLVREPDASPHAPDSDSQRIRADLQEVRDRLRHRFGFDTLIGRGPSHQRLLDQIATAASTRVPVLIVGEPGTGRRLVARTIHQRGARPNALLIPLDCAALPPEILEHELFGDIREETFPGTSRLNLPENASVLLLEFLDLPRDLQGRLASVSEPHGRILATSTLDPEQARRQDRLRGDLYFRMTTLVIRLQPLRDRLEELPLLAQHLLERANQRSNRRRAGFTAEAMKTLTAYDWPGNLRELTRVIDAAHERTGGDLIGVTDLPAAIRGHLGASYTPPPLPVPITPLDDLLTQLERRLIEQALQRARQNKSRAAELLDISRPRLYRRIKELNIPEEPEPAEESSDPLPNHSPER